MWVEKREFVFDMIDIVLSKNEKFNNYMGFNIFCMI